jgi:hypothetical protein
MGNVTIFAKEMDWRSSAFYVLLLYNFFYISLLIAHIYKYTKKIQPYGVGYAPMVIGSPRVAGRLFKMV